MGLVVVVIVGRGLLLGLSPFVVVEVVGVVRVVFVVVVWVGWLPKLWVVEVGGVVLGLVVVVNKGVVVGCGWLLVPQGGHHWF